MGQHTEVTAAGVPANAGALVYPYGWVDGVFCYEVRDRQGVTLVCGLPLDGAIAEACA